jgi:hypothetical protein
VLLAQSSDADQSAIETVARAGLVVFGVTEGRMTFLPACRLTGQYLYMGTTQQQQHVTLEDERQVALNVVYAPGARPEAPPVKFDMVRVGRLASTRRRALKTALLGSCDGATHFARVLAIGGVAGPDAHAPSDCAAASERDKTAPAGCRRVLRADLVALDGPGDDPYTSDDDDPCPFGWALAAGVCVERRPSKPHECAEDPRECRVQCDLGSRSSCARLGRMLAEGDHGFVPDARGALTYYGRACDAGHSGACFEMGELYARSDRPFHDDEKALSLWNRACRDGHTAACVRLGLSFRSDPSGPRRALALFRRACSGGDAAGCLQAADLQRSAPKEDADQEIGVLLDLACDGDLAAGCARLAEWMKGHGAPNELSRGPAEKACRLGSPTACESEPGAVTR